MSQSPPCSCGTPHKDMPPATRAPLIRYRADSIDDVMDVHGHVAQPELLSPSFGLVHRIGDEFEYIAFMPASDWPPYPGNPMGLAERLHNMFLHVPDLRAARRTMTEGRDVAGWLFTARADQLCAGWATSREENNEPAAYFAFYLDDITGNLVRRIRFPDGKVDFERQAHTGFAWNSDTGKGFLAPAFELLRAAR